MQSLLAFLNLFLHLDVALSSVIHQIGPWSYVLLFVVIFCETGLVVAPFLPGDSLIFAAGALAAVGSLNIYALFATFVVAAIVGDAVNYALGYKCGFACLSTPWLHLKPEHLEKTQDFYDKHGSKAIFFARFVPIVRTIAPFISGIGQMAYSRFLSYNVLGATVWVGLFLILGFFFGQAPVVKENFTLVILGIIVVTSVPPIVEALRAGRKPAKVV